MFRWLTKLEVQLHLKSGRIIRFFAEEIKTTRQNNGELTGLDGTGTRGWPLYIRLDDVSAVTTGRVAIWKGLER